MPFTRPGKLLTWCHLALVLVALTLDHGNFYPTKMLGSIYLPGTIGLSLLVSYTFLNEGFISYGFFRQSKQTTGIAARRMEMISTGALLLMISMVLLMIPLFLQ